VGGVYDVGLDQCQPAPLRTYLVAPGAWPAQRRTLWGGTHVTAQVVDTLARDVAPPVNTVRRRGGFRATARPRSRRAEGRRQRARANPDDGVILYGWHSVTAALANPARRIRRLLATENAARRLADDGIALPIAPELVRPDTIAARLTPDAVHQGLLVEADPLPSPALADLASARLVLALDQITDPHNVGAILRTAAAFAVAAVVVTARHSPEATGVLAKSASGALELVPLVIVQNLARALTEMRERGFLVVGLDSDATHELGSTVLAAPLALVLGAEGKGLRQGTRAVCDRLARLALPGAIKSLNVSNAAALALYIANRELADR
jgi:23S rRNA (guanosine2251-2'-O)-methyltransferase